MARPLGAAPQVYHTLSKILKKKFGGDATLIGDEGGFAPPCDARSGIELVMEAIEQAGYAGKCTVGLDVAASEFKVGAPLLRLLLLLLASSPRLADLLLLLLLLLLPSGQRLAEWP